MNWINLDHQNVLDEIGKESNENPVLIFKHSTRCSISKVVLSRLERNWDMQKTNHIKLYFLDLISYRHLSEAVASRYDVHHESPQVLIIRNGKAIYHQSHFNIEQKEIERNLL